MKRKFGISLLFVVMLLFSLITTTLAKDDSSDWLVPPDHKYAGKTYEEWGGLFWQYALTLPDSVTFYSFFSGANCIDTNQHYDVYFLAGSWSGPLTRNCTIPADKPLFFPLVNQGYFEIPKYYNPPTYSPKTIVKDLNKTLNQKSGTTAYASVDGKPIVSTRNQMEFFSVTDYKHPYSVVWPSYGADLGGYPGEIYEIFQGGYYVMLKLSPRSAPYTIKFGGNQPGNQQDLTTT